MAIDARNANDWADQMLDLTARRNALVLEEVEALKARRLSASSKDWDEKERLAHAYRHEMARIAKAPERLTGLSPERRDRLMATTQAFEQLLEDHAIALGAMRDVSEGLVRSIATEIGKAKSGPKGYGAGGALTSSTSGQNGIAVNAKA